MKNEKVKCEFYRLRKKDLDFNRYTCLSWPPHSHNMTALFYRNLANPSSRGSLRLPRIVVFRRNRHA